MKTAKCPQYTTQQRWEHKKQEINTKIKGSNKLSSSPLKSYFCEDLMKELLTLILHLRFFKVSGRKCASGCLNLCTRTWTHLGRRSHTINRNAFMTLTVCVQQGERKAAESFFWFPLHQSLCNCRCTSAWPSVHQLVNACYTLQLKAQQLSWMLERCSPPDSRCKIRGAVFLLSPAWINTWLKPRSLSVYLFSQFQWGFYQNWIPELWY